jgi:hypothetical protein
MFALLNIWVYGNFMSFTKGAIIFTAGAAAIAVPYYYLDNRAEKDPINESVVTLPDAEPTKTVPVSTTVASTIVPTTFKLAFTFDTPQIDCSETTTPVRIDESSLAGGNLSPIRAIDNQIAGSNLASVPAADVYPFIMKIALGNSLTDLTTGADQTEINAKLDNFPLGVIQVPLNCTYDGRKVISAS